MSFFWGVEGRELDWLCRMNLQTIGNLELRNFQAAARGREAFMREQVRGSAAANGAVTLDQVKATATLSPFKESI